MKTTNRILILMAVLSLIACKNKPVPAIAGPALVGAFFQSSVPSVHVITLYVNTDDIDTHNIDENADFGQASHIPNKEYTTYVRKGDIIIWTGVSTTNKLDVVNITQINHEGGPSLFGKNVLNGNKDVPEVVVGIITKVPEMDKDSLPDPEKYKLKFTIMNEGKEHNGTLTIDPKLQVVP